MSRTGRNHAASVRERLLRIARERNEDFNLVLSRYATERLLYRLSLSPHAKDFVVKGATLFSLWQGEPHRATRDLDLLGVGEPTVDRLKSLFENICGVPVDDDGLQFDASSVQATRIKEDADYEGVRVTLKATLAVARISVQVDVGFGDAVTPAPKLTTFPTLLNHPAPRLRSYPPETVIAEKLHALVVLGMDNSRMKDLFDLWTFASKFAFKGAVLVKAVRATFDRRKTPLPSEEPIALTETFSEDKSHVAQWNAFLRKAMPREAPTSLSRVIETLRPFLLPVLETARAGDDRWERDWPKCGPWTEARG